MFDKPFNLQIITPTSVELQQEAVSVRAPGVMGSFQVLHDHAPLVSELEVGLIRIMTKEGNEVLYATGGGFLEVKQNAVVVLADSVELDSKIDRDRAEKARDRAEERLRSKDPATDLERARLAMLRALNRLRVSSKS